MDENQNKNYEDNGNQDADGVPQVQLEDNRMQPSDHQNAIVGGNQENNTVADRTNFITKQAGLVGFGGIVIAATFAALCTWSTPYHESEKLKLKVGDIWHHNKLPPKLFLFILLTFVFSSGFLVTVIPLWKMAMEWSFYLRALVVVTATGFYATFCVILNEKLPNFTLGSIPGFFFVWLLGCSLIFLGVAAYAIISKAYRRIISSYHQ
ncbi:unnamed protein product [Camellia sinensis]